MSAVRKTMEEKQKWVFVAGRKYKKYSVFEINNFFQNKDMDSAEHVVRECNFKTSGRRYCKRLS